MKKTNNCPHPQDALKLVVISVVLTCETTRVKCMNCGQFITKPETDCR